MSNFKALPRIIHGPVRRVVLAFAVVGLFATVGVSPAFAESPWWQLSSSSRPTSLPTTGKGTIVLSATDLGDAPANGAASTITITDRLPAGLTVTGAAGTAGEFPVFGGAIGLGYMECPAQSGGEVNCTYRGSIPSSERLTVEIQVEGAIPSGTVNEARITGGEAPSVSVRRPLIVSSEPVRFGIADNELVPEEAGGTLDTRAGSHPFQLTSTFALNETGGVAPFQPAQPKDEDFVLPVGLVGNPTPFPRCTGSQFGELGTKWTNGCPDDTAVGVAMVTAYTSGAVSYGDLTEPVPLFNLEPSPGEPARFGFDVLHNPVVLDTAVRTGSTYGLEVKVSNTTQTAAFQAARVTFWGVPGDPRHDSSRGWGCVSLFFDEEEIPCSPTSHVPEPPPLLTLPSSCSAPFETSATTDSWSDPGAFTPPAVYTLRDAQGEPEPLDGCNQLPFEPSISVQPDGEAGSTPTGLKVDVNVPQEASLNPEGLADADVRDTTVTLPAGVQLSPSGADGLQACSDAQVGFTGANPVSGIDEFTDARAACPAASKIATVKIKTPLLPNALEGSVYLAAPQNFTGPLENPFGSLVAMYIVAEDPVSGVLVKLPGRTSPDPVTGQITTTFENTPQLPFEQLELHFFGTSRAPLSTPARCGSYETQASFRPWSASEPVDAGEVAQAASTFEISSGPNGSACPGAALPFTPTLSGGTTNLQAAGFTPLTTTITREDGQQNIQAVQLHMPAGLSGVLSGVKLCGEAQADAGTCGPESLIGSTIVSVGLGADPYSVTGGKVYITGPYNGKSACAVGTPECAPFGLSIVNPASAGPFVLQEGRPVVVRAKIEVDPHTAALTITTDNSGPYKIPTILDGIPLQIKHVNVTIERKGFTFNPTSCDPMGMSGTIASAEGASSPVSVPFQVTDCAALKFQPKFASSTAGRTTRSKGASLSVKLTYPSTPQGTEANIARVKVDLPKQLPSRLTTLQKACLAKVFEANPANCPSASVVGHAKAITPILPVPLEGPAYFVSHGGEAFPSLIVVLQGYGVTVDLVGTTFISHAGITSSTFKTVPDVPVGSFELNLPEGKYSALAANLPVKAHSSFCGQKLAMPTAFVAQNGQEIHESTKIAVSSCSKAKPAKKRREAAKKKGGSKKKRK